MNMTIKTDTDSHWNEQAQTVISEKHVNTADIYQRSLENDFIVNFLHNNMKLLEIGCGNGFSTNVFRDHVKWVDSIDSSEKMIQRAKKIYGEINNKFFYDNLFDPIHISQKYDVIICVRVLINLKNMNEQQQAIQTISKHIKPNGLFIMLEGFKNGFIELNKLRLKVGLQNLIPAKINTYSDIHDIMPILNELFIQEHEYNQGMYDFLTRIYYPMVTEPIDVKHNTIYSEQAYHISKLFIHSCEFSALSRIKGGVYRKKDND